MKTSESDKNMWFRKMFSCAVVTAVLFLGAYLWDTKISRPATSAATAKNISATLPEKSKYKHTRIADIKVGERVVTSSDDTAKPTAVDSVTWNKGGKRPYNPSTGSYSVNVDMGRPIGTNGEQHIIFVVEGENYVISAYPAAK